MHFFSNEFFISPAHKRTVGRAPVWGSEFTTKAAALQGGFRTRTRTNTNPNGTEANAAGRCIRACVACESIR